MRFRRNLSLGMFNEVFCCAPALASLKETFHEREGHPLTLDPVKRPMASTHVNMVNSLRLVFYSRNFNGNPKCLTNFQFLIANLFRYIYFSFFLIKPSIHLVMILLPIECLFF